MLPDTAEQTPCALPAHFARHSGETGVGDGEGEGEVVVTELLSAVVVMSPVVVPSVEVVLVLVEVVLVSAAVVLVSAAPQQLHPDADRYMSVLSLHVEGP